jgi:hypothetical protein
MACLCRTYREGTLGRRPPLAKNSGREVQHRLELEGNDNDPD